MARHHPDLVFCRKQPGIAIGKLCEKCDGRCVICDTHVRPCTLVRVCDECNYGTFQNRCVICGGPGVSDAYYCKECTLLEKDREGCPKIINLGSARTDYFYERKKGGPTKFKELQSKPCDFSTRREKVFIRPHVKEFLENISTIAQVGIWTSAVEKNARVLVKKVVECLEPTVKIDFVFDRSKCDIVNDVIVEVKKSGYNKPLAIKDLEKVWSEYPEYSSRNTLLIDDSALKTQKHPLNALIVPEFTLMKPDLNVNDDKVLIDAWQWISSNYHENIVNAAPMSMEEFLTLHEEFLIQPRQSLANTLLSMSISWCLEDYINFYSLFASIKEENITRQVKQVPFYSSLKELDKIRTNRGKLCVSENEKLTWIQRETLPLHVRLKYFNHPRLDKNVVFRESLASKKWDMNQLYHQSFDLKIEKTDFSLMSHPVLSYRFNDLRLKEVEKMLNCAEPVRWQGDHHGKVNGDYQTELLCVSHRTLSLGVGRALLMMRTRKAARSVPWQFPELAVNVVFPPFKTAVNFPCSTDLLAWPLFHNGVAIALSLSTDSDIDDSWIHFHRPNEPSPSYAGFLFGLGLIGKLNHLSYVDAYQLLANQHELTSISILLGIAVNERGTLHSKATKLCSLHVPCLLSESTFTLPFTSSISILALGFLHYGTCHRRMTEVFVAELTRRDHYGNVIFSSGTEEGFKGYAEWYALSAGFALGLCLIGKGEGSGMNDLRLGEQLAQCIKGKRTNTSFSSQRVRDNNWIHVNVTCAAATVAHSLMYLKSNNYLQAQLLECPNNERDSMRPDLLLLQVLCRWLILWDHVPMHEPHNVFGNTPEAIQSRVAVITGWLLAIAIKFAGTNNSAICTSFKTVISKIDELSKRLAVGTNFAQRIARSFTRHCYFLAFLGWSIVVAGTGDLDIIRRLRPMHGRLKQDMHYGRHMMVNMALGFACLGGGILTLQSNTNDAVAGLLMTVFPLFPIHPHDQQYHCQMLRHMWVLAVENRCLVTYHSDRVVSVPVHIVKQNGTSAYLKTPCLLDSVDDLQSVSIVPQSFHSITFVPNWEGLFEKIQLFPKDHGFPLPESDIVYDIPGFELGHPFYNRCKELVSADIVQLCMKNHSPELLSIYLEIRLLAQEILKGNPFAAYSFPKTFDDPFIKETRQKIEYSLTRWIKNNLVLVRNAARTLEEKIQPPQLKDMLAVIWIWFNLPLGDQYKFLAEQVREVKKLVGSDSYACLLVVAQAVTHSDVDALQWIVEYIE